MVILDRQVLNNVNPYPNTCINFVAKLRNYLISDELFLNYR